MGDLRINFIDNWEKKDVNLEELRHALEDGNSSLYTDASLKKVSGKWKKFKERGISNLYLVKELEDDGVACAYYAYSITDGVIDDETLERIREICAQQLSSGEMRADGSFSKPDEWWDTNPLRSIKAVESGSAWKETSSAAQAPHREMTARRICTQARCERDDAPEARTPLRRALRETRPPHVRHPLGTKSRHRSGRVGKGPGRTLRMTRCGNSRQGADPRASRVTCGRRAPSSARRPGRARRLRSARARRRKAACRGDRHPSSGRSLGWHAAGGPEPQRRQAR